MDMVNRPKKVDFPVEIEEVYHGKTQHLVMNENTTVTCVYCKKEFLVNRDTAYPAHSIFDTTPYVRCPKCNKKACIVYYFDRIVKPKSQPQKRLKNGWVDL